MIRIKSRNNLGNTQLRNSLSYQILINDKEYDISLSASDKVLFDNMETPLALALPAAMSLSLPIFVDDSISREYLENINKLMEHYEINYSNFHKVPIKCKSILDFESIKKKRIGSFFSGGVDSFYTLLKRLDEIDTLIVLYGFDIKLKDTEKINKTKLATRKVAGNLKKQIIEIEGNFTKIITDYCDWVTEGHGFALVSVSRALSNLFDIIYIPGTHSVRKQKNWGSSIYTDQLHSDSKLSIVHDSDQSERIEKLIYISDTNLVLENLRVCGDIPYDGNYNCCQCEKCVRTMLQLWSIRKLEQSSAFHLPLTPQIIRSTLITREAIKDYYRQSLDFAKKNKIKDNDILIAIETSLARPLWLSNFLTKYRRKKKHVIRNLRKIFHKAFSENINISKPK
jgi:hypothetical protein